MQVFFNCILYVCVNIHTHLSLWIYQPFSYCVHKMFCVCVCVLAKPICVSVCVCVCEQKKTFFFVCVCVCTKPYLFVVKTCLSA